MSSLFQNKYRVESSRLKNHDYSGKGSYFVTICTNNKIPYFGEIVSGKVIYTIPGQIAAHFWNEIPEHFPSIKLDEFIIMPDHIHGIIIFENVETPNLGVSTTITKWKPRCLGLVINQFKRICTIEIRKSGQEFKWHSGYYDHIIRNNAELCRIRKYIRGNPKNASLKKRIGLR